MILFAEGHGVVECGGFGGGEEFGVVGDESVSAVGSAGAAGGGAVSAPFQVQDGAFEGGGGAGGVAGFDDAVVGVEDEAGEGAGAQGGAGLGAGPGGTGGGPGGECPGDAVEVVDLPRGIRIVDLSLLGG